MAHRHPRLELNACHLVKVLKCHHIPHRRRGRFRMYLGHIRTGRLLSCSHHHNKSYTLHRSDRKVSNIHSAFYKTSLAARNDAVGRRRRIVVASQRCSVDHLMHRHDSHRSNQSPKRDRHSHKPAQPYCTSSPQHSRDLQPQGQTSLLQPTSRGRVLFPILIA